MKKELINLFLFLGICFVAYLFFKGMNYNYKEGMTADQSTSSSSNGVAGNGVAGSAASYAATIKDESVKLNDTLLISKYRKDYENVILNVDDLIDSLMLKTALTIDTTNPLPSLTKLSEMNQAKTALNSVMKFVDASN
jgi:hypothetical protein